MADIEVVIRVKVPKVPNFILAADGALKWPLDHFSDEDLEEIAAQWGSDLLARAKAMRIDRNANS